MDVRHTGNAAGFIGAAIDGARAEEERRARRRWMASQAAGSFGFRMADEFAESMRHVAEVIADHFLPALDGFAFAMQRAHVEQLLAEPWYRHVRERWALRQARQWADVWPATLARRHVRVIGPAR